MKGRLPVLVLLMGLAMVTPAAAAPITFTALLNGVSESPSNASPGTGLALVTIDAVAHTLEVDVTFQDLLGPNSASHIHVINGPGDANTADTLGPVATMTPTFTGFPGGTTSGSYLNTFDSLNPATYRAGFVTDSGGTAASAEAQLFAAIVSGRAYLNIHTSVFPGGEIRGFLEPKVVPVPEPSLLLLLGAGAVAVVKGMRGRSRA